MKEITLHPNPWKTFFLLLISLTFVATGIRITISEPGNWIGWLGVVFFGLCAVFFILNTLPNFSYLKLNKEGFEICSIGKKHFYFWREIEIFQAVNLSFFTKIIVFNFSENFIQSKKIKRFSSPISGWEGGLHDTFGMKPEKLAALMNEYLAKAK
jgi:hypothetical protein